jgi:alkylhydroperoxidase family enzyme
VRKLLAPTPHEGDRPFNIFTTLARHPTLMRRWLPFGTQMLAGELPARDRELLILRTAWNCRSAYEWGQHVRIGLGVGLAQAEIDRVPAGPSAAGWSPFDAALLAAADELHADACVSDATWRALAERYGETQLIEVPMLVGQYHMVAFTLNSLGIQREPGVPDLPSRAS